MRSETESGRKTVFFSKFNFLLLFTHYKLINDARLFFIYCNHLPIACLVGLVQCNISVIHKS